MKDAYAAKLKHISNYVLRGDAPTYSETLGIPVINQACVWLNGLDFSKIKYHDPNEATRITSWIHEGDILVNSTGTGTLGRVAIVEAEPTMPMFADGHVTVVRDTCHRYYPKFLFYCLSIQQDTLTALCSEGATNQIELSRAKFGNFTVILPPLSEQRSIAQYLDRQIAKLDTLIKLKQRLLELLAEKRRALIKHAVTRGLNSDVLMQNSDIEWLGRIPKHWQIVKLKHLGKIGNGSTPLRETNAYWQDGTFPWLTSTVVNDDVVGEPTEFVTEVALLEYHLPIVQPNSILVAITGEGKTRGKAALLRYQATINQHMAFISPQTDLLLPEFLQLYLAGLYEILRMISEGTGSTKGALTCEQIGEFPTPLPSLNEQRSIVSYIKSKISKLDALKTVTEHTVALLQERRTSLIAAAVTGQIQVTT